MAIKKNWHFHSFVATFEILRDLNFETDKINEIIE